MYAAESATAVFRIVFQSSHQDAGNPFFDGGFFSPHILFGFALFYFACHFAGKAQGFLLLFQLLGEGVLLQGLLFFVEVVVSAVIRQSLGVELADGRQLIQ